MNALLSISKIMPCDSQAVQISLDKKYKVSYLMEVKMTNELIEYLKEKAAENVNNLSSIRLLNNNDYSFEAILEAKNCDIKIHESTRQFQLFISKKDNNWISMYWVAKYLKIPYQIFTIEQLSGAYDEILKKQIDYICSFIKNYIEVLDSFYGKNIDKDILKIRENAKQ